MYHVGHDEAGNPVEPTEGPLRAAGSARVPPLTKEQWAALDRIYGVGAGTGAASPEVMKGSLRAAASVRLPPLTKAQWAHLDRLYHVGLSGYFDLSQLQGAELQSAASEAEQRGRPVIAAVVKTPIAPIDYSRNPAHVAHSDMAARAMAQPLPRLPAGLRLQHLPTGVVARFHIAADGAESVELQQPTSDEALDRILLDALKMWRFTPAYKNGQAVASMVDVQLTISTPK
ncbi:MAG TPA: hypothetical protein VN668_08435 [Stellaceae bacterium]|nr:hypothetical protein [Stellaceae bacterium]